MNTQVGVKAHETTKRKQCYVCRLSYWVKSQMFCLVTSIFPYWIKNYTITCCLRRNSESCTWCQQKKPFLNVTISFIWMCLKFISFNAYICWLRCIYDFIDFAFFEYFLQALSRFPRTFNVVSPRLTSYWPRATYQILVNFLINCHLFFLRFFSCLQLYFFLTLYS